MIETERLIIRPLNYDQLLKYSRCDGSLEVELNLNETSRTISADLREALDNTIIPNVADTNKNYLYATIWTAISKTDNKMIGDLCIYGEPNTDGEIEIGYGTYDEFQNRGYMTEVVNGMISWARREKKVKAIRASTDKLNKPSWKVLEKNNFTKVGESESLVHWKLILH
jgi:RimJ/RimL family protein N-acetyltransferase